MKYTCANREQEKAKKKSGQQRVLPAQSRYRVGHGLQSQLRTSA